MGTVRRGGGHRGETHDDRGDGKDLCQGLTGTPNREQKIVVDGVLHTTTSTRKPRELEEAQFA